MTHVISHSLRWLAILPIFFALSPRARAQTGPIVLGGFPTLRQQHALTCESSAASMGTRAAITESQLMSVIPRNPNPNLGFRGNPSGPHDAGLINYGVYAAPVQQALARYDYHSDLLSYASRNDIVRYINRGWPVVAWVTYSLMSEHPRLASANGASFVLVPMEHAILVIGYDAQTVIANDPWTASQVRYSWRDFQRSWGLFGNMGLAIEPCPKPHAVGQISVASLGPAGLTWKWTPARNATQYGVTVTLQGATKQVVFHGIQAERRFTLSNPTPGASYEISVRARSACGGVAALTRQWVTVPPAPPSLTPTTTPTTSVPGTQAPTASPTRPAPTGTATAAPTATHML